MTTDTAIAPRGAPTKGENLVEVREMLRLCRVAVVPVEDEAMRAKSERFCRKDSVGSPPE